MSREPSELTWEDEAQGVIADVSQHLKDIAVSSALQSSKSRIYINLTTLENQPYTVELSASGFRVTAKRYDSCDENEMGPFCDTPYSLLSTISPAFPGNFAEALRRKLEGLQNQGEGLDDVDD